MAQDMPEMRSFLQTFSPQPYDITEEAWADTFQTVEKYGDMQIDYFDEGVPWPEAFEGKPYKPNVEEDFQRRLQYHGPGKRSLLALCPMAQDRKNIALYRGDEDWMERPGIWKDKTFDDPDVIQAYLNYCRTMIGRFKPDYMFYACEVDHAIMDADSTVFKQFLAFVKEVHATLRREYPALPLCMEFMLGLDDEMKKREEVTKQLLPYTDIYAISTYPYMMKGIGGNPANIPRDFFSKIRRLTDKPFAVMETGWPAQDVVLESQPMNIPCTPEWQEQYVRFLLEEAGKLDAEFVVWWVVRDYEPLWEKMKASGAPEYMKVWLHSGLLKADGTPRPSLAAWERWHTLPLRHKPIR